MEIRELATLVLFSDRLEDKLLTPAALTDHEPGSAIEAPTAPGRPAPLAFQTRENRFAFPGSGKIRDTRDIGETLHYFANHELLAVELMALCLLKFPDAPAAFRRGIANTLLEEQEHVRLYHRRMVDCGVSFGEIPVGDFFWRVTAPMTSPSQFLARMSLTFEQANLDYSCFYSGLFGRLGDADTAALMTRVYEDEIRHVRLGLHWFNRWRDPNQSLFDSYAKALDRPLSPVRARGIGFNRPGRELAGLPTAFIDTLEVFGQSRGRSPDLFRFDPLAEERCRPAGPRENRAIRQLAADLAVLPTVLASADDAVIVPQVPDQVFLARLAQAGLPLPEYIAADSPATLGPLLAGRRIRRYQPWAWGPDQPDWAAAADRAADCVPAFAQAADKRSLVAIRRQVAAAAGFPLPPGFGDSIAVTSDAELAAALAALATAGFPRAMLKPAFGAAGRDNRVVPTDTAAALAKAMGPAILEPWYDFVLLGSTQLEISIAADGNATIRLLGDTLQCVRRDGAYTGTITGAIADAMPPDVRRLLYGDGRKGLTALHAAARVAGRAAAAMGYTGPAGIDWGIARCTDGLAIHPLIELNPRFTMGRVALAMYRRTAPARTGMLAFVSPRTAQTLAAIPMDCDRRTGQALLAGGVLPLTDPVAAQTIAALWIVAASPQACLAACRT